MQRHTSMRHGGRESSEAVFGLRKGLRAYPSADRVSLVPPRCGKQGPARGARIDRSLSTDTASFTAAGSVGSSMCYRTCNAIETLGGRRFEQILDAFGLPRGRRNIAALSTVSSNLCTIGCRKLCISTVHGLLQRD